MFVNTSGVTIQALDNPDASSNFASESIFSDSKRIKGMQSKYRSTLHVAATSNLCERLFSAARLIMNHLRCNMDPEACELLLFLKFNRRLWDNPRIIDDILADLRAVNDAEGANDDEMCCANYLLCMDVVFIEVLLSVFNMHNTQYNTIVLQL
jgi:hypothetical protein